ncbi:hypothetical protein IC582_023303 [Cucumis melo]|uniref:Methyltransferase n=2 Tax=Cucumis melo TaxID=3656 RepID=A0A5A7ST91_CUCMM|nr:probable methyltransferase At1g27930 [Cucumis melo]KAA0034190.1 putative methyltransferase [Cucumis melo var. makuwa]TYK15731.1 putative methyltransferase [Cucumis melo var. makuwa]
MKNRISAKPWILGLAVAGLIAGSLLISGYIGFVDSNLFCSISGTGAPIITGYSPAEVQFQSIIHYATSKTVPQQSIDEIHISYDVLKVRCPCNFLVFGLGHDSLMWASLNPLGTTIFLEEDPKWVQTVLKDAPMLRAYHVQYRTQLQEADRLLSTYKSEPYCSPTKAFLKGNEKCKLALHNLPEEIYEKEWDLIMIDAPRGYFAEAPGRMAAIFSAAVMARNRKGSGVTDVFLHDVDRKVERTFAQEFLCKNKYYVNGVGRLWHFKIPPAANMSEADRSSDRFC